jgi:hypothetical protein
VGPKGSNVDTAIDQFDCGVRVACGDTRALVAGLRALVAAPDRLAALKRNAREAFEMAYCDVRTLPQFDRLFERLLGEGERVGAEFADGRQQSAPV